MAQSFQFCPLLNVAVVNPAGDGYDPVIVGGSGALSSEDGDTSYAEIGAYPGEMSGAAVVGTFTPAVIPEGHYVTGIFLRVVMRASGNVASPNLQGGFWDSAHDATWEEAWDSGWLFDSSLYPDDEATYAVVSPDTEDGAYGFIWVDDAGWWSEMQAEADPVWGQHFTVPNLAAGTIKFALRGPGYYSTNAPDFKARVTSVELVYRHSPPPTAGFTEWIQPPDVVVFDGAGETARVLATESQTESPQRGGFGANWNDAGQMDASWNTIMHLSAPDDTYSAPLLGSGTGNEAFVYMDGAYGDNNVDYQNRMSLAKYQPSPLYRWVNSGSGPLAGPQVAGSDAIDADHAGYAADLFDPNYETYEVEMAQVEVSVHFWHASTATFGNPIVGYARLFDEQVLPAPTETEFTAFGSLLHPDAPVSWWRYSYPSFPAISGALQLITPLSTGTGGVLADRHGELFESANLGNGPGGDHETDWVDITDLVVDGGHGDPAFYLHYSMYEQLQATIPGDSAPGMGWDKNFDYTKAVGMQINGRLTLHLPRYRFAAVEMQPLFVGAVGRWLRQRQVPPTGLAQRNQPVRGLAARQGRWR